MTRDSWSASLMTRGGSRPCRSSSSRSSSLKAVPLLRSGSCNSFTPLEISRGTGVGAVEPRTAFGSKTLEVVSPLFVIAQSPRCGAQPATAAAPCPARCGDAGLNTRRSGCGSTEPAHTRESSVWRYWRLATPVRGGGRATRREGRRPTARGLAGQTDLRRRAPPPGRASVAGSRAGLGSGGGAHRLRRLDANEAAPPPRVFPAGPPNATPGTVRTHGWQAPLGSWRCWMALVPLLAQGCQADAPWPADVPLVVVSIDTLRSDRLPRLRLRRCRDPSHRAATS